VVARTPTRTGPRNGRLSAELLAELRKEIIDGRFGPGQYLPTVRELSATHGLARKTVNGVLKKLQAEGLVSSEPRKGYRVLARAADPDLGCPLAYVADLTGSPDAWMPLHQELLSAFQGAAATHGWTLMGLGSGGRDRKTVMRQLLDARACGLAIDAVDADIVKAISEAGLPAVAVDTWNDDFPIDAVVQDSHRGGVLAANYLAEQGHQKIAWFGPTTWSAHSRARLAGTLVGLLENDLEINTRLICSATRDNSAAEARALLSGSDRPAAIVSLFLENALQLIKSGRELGLTVGQDFELVGWCTEAQYQRDWLPAFAGAAVSPAIVWSPKQMACLAVDRLEARRKNPHQMPVKISVPVQLRQGGNS
jgi:DNA-binding LacI/PurR family transcriptional regulator